ncbi:MAG: DMT family transporter, partial [Oscillospiraceae bacterium]|nr:DMT family transporter [Oscillospiraceae bacterium]
MKKEHLKGNLFLLAAALIWGIAFVAQSEGLKYVGPFTMQATRFTLAGLLMVPLIVFGKRKPSPVGLPFRKVLLSGALCGAFLWIGSTLQQCGLLYTTVGKSGFITALYIVLVPLMGIFLHKRVGVQVWVAVAIAVVGLYYLCMTDMSAINIGDIMTLACALFFCLQILCVDKVGGMVDGIWLSCIQSLTCAVISYVPMFLFETPRMDAILDAWLPIAYAGILSGGVAYCFQILGQRSTAPSVASLLMSLEAVFAAL